MEYKIVVEDYAGQKMIHTYIYGTLTPEDRDHIGAETVQKLKDNHITKCIWDVREAELSYSIFEVHQSVLKAEGDFYAGKTNNVAIIYRQNRREFEHAKTAAYNRHLSHLDFFQDINEGIHWLTNKSE